ncbi:hypothetical protein [Azospirillum sp. Sh1]|uniref:hypothetical protein n=1 Tax=Azospirillum sp. Sh1 TaxID=2607285 RepID=UPI0011ED6FCC|nr:hypothetical protein [Azospirillum sp. Sh1]KAA0570386.1 hypothetical protein FZ029_30500 [Azospirillum sp. Sh1]
MLGSIRPAIRHTGALRRIRRENAKSKHQKSSVFDLDSQHLQRTGTAKLKLSGKNLPDACPTPYRFVKVSFLAKSCPIGDIPFLSQFCHGKPPHS